MWQVPRPDPPTPEHVATVAAGGGSAGAAAARAAAGAGAPHERLRGRYLLYSPCVGGGEVGRCYGQFNNQLALLAHALAVAAAMSRVLVRGRVSLGLC